MPKSFLSLPNFFLPLSSGFFSSRKLTMRVLPKVPASAGDRTVLWPLAASSESSNRDAIRPDEGDASGNSSSESAKRDLNAGAAVAAPVAPVAPVAPFASGDATVVVAFFNP